MANYMISLKEEATSPERRRRNLTLKRTTSPRVKFPHRLHQVLSEVEEQGLARDIISWLPCGTRFKIHDKKRFTEEIMPRISQCCTRYRSFSRQLTLYKFKRDSKSTDPKLQGAYYHPSFQRDRVDLCQTIKRLSQAEVLQARRMETAAVTTNQEHDRGSNQDDGQDKTEEGYNTFSLLSSRGSAPSSISTKEVYLQNMQCKRTQENEDDAKTSKKDYDKTADSDCNFSKKVCNENFTFNEGKNQKILDPVKEGKAKNNHLLSQDQGSEWCSTNKNISFDAGRQKINMNYKQRTICQDHKYNLYCSSVPNRPPTSTHLLYSCYNDQSPWSDHVSTFPVATTNTGQSSCVLSSVTAELSLQSPSIPRSSWPSLQKEQQSSMYSVLSRPPRLNCFDGMNEDIDNEIIATFLP